MEKIKVNLKKRSYDILVGEKILADLGKILKELKFAFDIVVITDNLVGKIYGDKIKNSLKSKNYRTTIEIFPAGEKSKSFTQYKNLINKLHNFERENKSLLLIALGGGVIGDLTGFAAATYKRGIPLIHIPTTLLAQIDSAIGGKTGINTSFGKNLVGVIYQPKLVINDLSLLKTLPPREIKSGLAEAVKYGIIKREKLFNFIENNLPDIKKLNLQKIFYVVKECCKIKSEIVSQDERDDVAHTQIRIILNFGHSLGHAIEAAAKYKKYNHGEAVAIGMVGATEIAISLGLTNLETKNKIEKLLSEISLPVYFSGCNVKEVLTHLKFDKKFSSGKNRFVLPKKIGEVILKENVEQQIILNAIKSRKK